MVGGDEKWVDLECISKVLLARLTDGLAIESFREISAL